MPSTLNEFLEKALNEKAPKFGGGFQSDTGKRNKEFADEAIRYITDSLVWIKPFVKEGFLNKKHLKNIDSLLTDLKHIKVRS